MRTLAPLLSDLYDPIEDGLAAAQRIFDEELLSELPFVNSLCDQVRSYWGKKLRPALLLLSAKATGELSTVHHTLAAVVEMVHMATLVHDDVLDEADERRRRPTVCETEGNVAAVLLGDYLISHAFHLCSGLGSRYASRRIGATTNTVCEGELLQNHRRGYDRLSEPEYIEIVRRKTGALTAVACELGAHYARADEPVVKAMHAYGLAAGVAFQIVDDVLDIVGDRGRMGKTLGTDLLMGKLTLPTIHCLSNAGEATASALRAVVLGDPGCGRQRLCDWLDETGSIEYAFSVADGYVADALRQLDWIPPGEVRESLAALAQFIVERRY
jgi:octaprenyl-diphosphate synthase